MSKGTAMATKKKNKIRVRKNVPRLVQWLQERVDLYTAIILSTWNAAMELPYEHAKLKKKEAVGWACSMARVIAEEEVDQNKNLAECLRRAAEELLSKAAEFDCE